MNVIVIGAGPAGMMAAGIAAEAGAKVRLFDKNGFAGKKLNITGKGRCNIANNCDHQEFLKNVVSNPKFLQSAISKFSPADTMDFFENKGLHLKTERGRRVFPISEKARDVTDALIGWLKSNGVTVERKRVDKLLFKESDSSNFSSAVCGVVCGAEKILTDSVIVATGGLSYPLTGSTGDGYYFAEQSGHRLIPTEPSLTSLLSGDSFCVELQGLSLKNVSITVKREDGKVVWSDGPGEMLFTHFGVSGPMILSASATAKSGYTLFIDLKPGLDEKQLDARMIRDFEKYNNRELTNALGDLLHKSIIPVILSISGLDPTKRINSFTKDERRKLLMTIKALPVKISGKPPVDEAVVTRGGVNVRDIDPRTMQSKLTSGLYFAGEVLDVDAFTGGYNLQIAWSTGFLAGQSVYNTNH